MYLRLILLDISFAVFLLNFNVYLLANSNLSTTGFEFQIGGMNVPRHIARCSITREFVHDFLGHAQHYEKSNTLLVVPVEEFMESVHHLALSISTREV